MKLSALIGMTLLCLAATACGGGGGDEPADAWNCSYEARAEPYTAGMNRTTAGGLTVAIVESTPAPPLRGNNAWRVSITDDQQAPLDDMTITIFPWMPDHGHGTPSVPQIAPLGGGEYSIDPVNLWMAGYWEATITVGDGVAPGEDVVFELCIDG